MKVNLKQMNAARATCNAVQDCFVQANGFDLLKVIGRDKCPIRAGIHYRRQWASRGRLAWSSQLNVKD